jgi:hypothetical protein
MLRTEQKQENKTQIMLCGGQLLGTPTNIFPTTVTHHVYTRSPTGNYCQELCFLFFNSNFTYFVNKQKLIERCTLSDSNICM